MKSKIIINLSLLLASGMLTPSVWSANSVAVNFKGNLILNSPCEVTGIGDGPIEIDFGDIIIRQIAGFNYRQEVPYTLTCDAPGTTEVALTFKGQGATFDSGALRSSNANLGFKFLVDNYPIRLNIDPMKFPNNRHDPIYVYPVRNGGVPVTGIAAGSFTASVTLEASYP